MQALDIATRKRCELVDVTAEVKELVAKSGVREGLCVVFCPHTTAGITVNENSDPDVQSDFLMALERAVPNTGFNHSEGNSDAHTKASLVGSSATLIVADGKLQLGRWQAIYLCEFDGPRRRLIWVKVQGD